MEAILIKSIVIVAIVLIGWQVVLRRWIKC
jgi:hypothetical protein